MKKNTPKILFSLVFMFILSFILTEGVFAQRNIFGTIDAPVGVAEYNAEAGVTGSNIGIIIFASNILKASTIVAGIWVMINFILAGWIYITSAGDSSAHEKVSSKLNMSIIGLLLIVGAYTIAALLGLVVFGDPGYILKPTFEGVATTPSVIGVP